MSHAIVIRDLPAWRECRDCGLFQRLPEIPDGEAAVCARCSAVLRRAARDTLTFARINAVVSAVLLWVALSLPLVDISAVGRSAHSTVLTGAAKLRDDGLPVLGLIVLVTLAVMPALKIGLEILVLFGVRAATPPRVLTTFFRWTEHIAPWAMIDVFLLGAFVAYTRLRELAHTEVGLAAVALFALMLTSVSTDATIDREAIWQELETKAPHPDASASARAREAQVAPHELVGCDECGRVTAAAEGKPCLRCGHTLAMRKGGFGSVWALLLGSALLYIPANVLPVMTVQRMGKGGPTTIFHGVVELIEAKLWPLALLVLLASVVVPFVKLGSLAAMMIMTHRGSSYGLAGRTTLFRFVKFIGRWSMLDIYMLAVLVGVVRFGALATVRPGMGAAAFCAVVILTMIATEKFDPRHMWDAAGRKESAFQPSFRRADARVETA